MKITKSQLKQIIKEEINEIKDSVMPSPSGTDQGINVVRRHLGEMVAELSEGGLDPDLSQTMPDSGHTAVVPDLDGLAAKMYRMIMIELGA